MIHRIDRWIFYELKKNSVEIQKVTDEYIKKIDERTSQKQTEILKV